MIDVVDPTIGGHASLPTRGKALGCSLEGQRVVGGGPQWNSSLGGQNITVTVYACSYAKIMFWLKQFVVDTVLLVHGYQCTSATAY